MLLAALLAVMSRRRAPPRRAAELLEGVCDVDLDALDVELPAGIRSRLRRTDAPAGIMGESDLMLDTHAFARSLTAADFTPAQADFRLVVEQGEHVTSDPSAAGGRVPPWMPFRGTDS